MWLSLCVLWIDGPLKLEAIRDLLLNELRKEDWVFEMAPQLTDLFPFGNDLTHPKFTAHALNVMNALDLAVQNLDNPDVLISTLQELGRVHAMFELTNQEFGYVRQALLSVLEEGLGEGFTPQLKAAWSDTFTIITDVMMGAITDYNAKTT